MISLRGLAAVRWRRVWMAFTRHYPTIMSKTENTNSVIDAMIRHVSAS